MAPHQGGEHLADWAAETHESIVARLEGAKASQSKIRLTIGLMAVISTMMLIASYNAYLSYDYEWMLEQTDKQTHDEEGLQSSKQGEAKVPVASDEKRVSDVLAEQAYKDWAAARIVTVSPLGIRVSVDDAPVLGTAVLFILSLWLVLLARLENYTIGSLLRGTDTPNPRDSMDPSADYSTARQPPTYSAGERWLIFHTIVSNNLFVTCDPSLSIINSLKPVKSLKGYAGFREGRRSSVAAAPGLRSRLSEVWFGFARSFFFLFPVVASFGVFILDRLSYRLRDPFLPGAPAPGTDIPFYNASAAVFYVCWLLLLICCLRSNQYSRATEKVLREYGGKLRVDLLRQQSSRG